MYTGTKNIHGNGRFAAVKWSTSAKTSRKLLVMLSAQFRLRDYDWKCNLDSVFSIPFWLIHFDVFSNTNTDFSNWVTIAWPAFVSANCIAIMVPVFALALERVTGLLKSSPVSICIQTRQNQAKHWKTNRSYTIIVAHATKVDEIMMHYFFGGKM